MIKINTKIETNTVKELIEAIDEGLHFVAASKEHDLLAFAGSKNYIVSQLKLIKTLLEIKDFASSKIEVADTLTFINSHQKKDPMYLTGGGQITRVVLGLIARKLQQHL